MKFCDNVIKLLAFAHIDETNSLEICHLLGLSLKAPSLECVQITVRPISCSKIIQDYSILTSNSKILYYAGFLAMETYLAMTKAIQSIPSLFRLQT